MNTVGEKLDKEEGKKSRKNDKDNEEEIVKEKWLTAKLFQVVSKIG